MRAHDNGKFTSVTIPVPRSGILALGLLPGTRSPNFSHSFYPLEESGGRHPPPPSMEIEKGVRSCRAGLPISGSSGGKAFT